MSDWSATPATINEAVWAAKQYLDDLFDKYETLEDLQVHAVGVVGSDILSETADNRIYQKVRTTGVGERLVSKLLGGAWETSSFVERALTSLQSDSVELQTARLRAREERQRLKAEAARLEADRLREEAAQKAQQEQERKAKAEQKRIEAEEKRKAEEVAALDMDDESEAILRGFAEQRVPPTFVLKNNFSKNISF